MSTLLKMLTPGLTVTCPDIHSKKRALEYLSELICQQQADLDCETLFTSFLERERLGSTAIGNGVAIPHIRSDQLTQPIAALLHLPEGVNFADDGQQAVDLIIGLVVPNDDPQQHLNALADIAKQFKNPDFRSQLRLATDNQSLHNIAINYNDQSRHFV